LDIEEPDVDAVVAGLDALGLSSRKDLFRRSTMACTGIEYCKLAIVETKQTAADAVTKLEERLDGLDLPHPISLHLNGCPNSCARIQTADIGLKGQIITNDEGQQVPGFQVHVGGGLASDRNTASSRSSRPSRPPPMPSRSSRSVWTVSICRTRSASTSTAARTPAPGSRPPTSVSRARSSPTTKASRCPASRSTSAGDWPRRTATRQGWGGPCAASRSPPTT